MSQCNAFRRASWVLLTPTSQHSTAKQAVNVGGVVTAVVPTGLSQELLDPYLEMNLQIYPA